MSLEGRRQSLEVVEESHTIVLLTALRSKGFLSAGTGVTSLQSSRKADSVSQDPD